MTSTHDIPLLLVGNSLAVLVAATERARLGLETTVLNPGRGWGGYFAGVQVMGQRRDAGMVLYEANSFREGASLPALESYDPMKRNDVGRFMGVIRAYLQTVQRTRPIATPQMWLDGQLMPDMMLGNAIDGLPGLPVAGQARRELSDIVQRIRPDASLCHPANKGTWSLDGSAPADWTSMTKDSSLHFDCDSISRLVHGNALHEALFLPFARQVMYRDASHLSALYHRLPWLPLYWPESLLSVLEGKASSLAPTRLSHPDGATVADFCHGLVARLQSDPLIRIMQDQPVALERDLLGFRLQTAHHGELHAARLGWAMTPAQGLALMGMTSAPLNDERLPVVLGFFRLSADQVQQAFSFVHTVGEGIGIYRVTNSTNCGAPADDGIVNLVVEANPRRLGAVHGISMADDRQVAAAMLRDLMDTGLIRAVEVMPDFELRRFDGALPLPAHQAVTDFLSDQTRLKEALPGIELMSASSAPFAQGLSDQVVQGLQVSCRGVSEDQRLSSGWLTRGQQVMDEVGV